MIKIAVAGALGRMGSRVLNAIATDPSVSIAAALVPPGHASAGQAVQIVGDTVKYADAGDAPFDILIDFTTPSASMHWLEHCVKRCRGIVIGTTGHTVDDVARINEAAAVIPILKSSNFSVGVNVLMPIVERLARELGSTHAIEIVEVHHARKADAPSGTALSLLDKVITAAGRDRVRDVVFGRSGAPGPRPQTEIGVHSVRMGDHVGTHTVYFSAAGETLSVRHEALSRDTFAAGAVRAAKWLHGRKAGMYSMRDCLEQ